jgi:hypothetical protein
MTPGLSGLPLLAFVILLSTQCSTYTVPQGTELWVRLQTKIASDASRPGDPVEAVLVIPEASEDRTLLPAGTVLRGTAKEVQTVSESNPRASIRLDFDTVVFGQGKSQKISTRVAEVDNARETVDATGLIVGILPSEAITARMDQQLEKLRGRFGGLASILQTAKNAFLGEAQPEIQYQPGTELKLRLTSPLSIEAGNVAAPGAAPQSIEPQEDLASMVNAQSFQTMAEKPSRPSDITNLMFLGPQEKLEAAFESAGWSTAAALSGQSKLETFRAIAEARGYKEAPVSVLLLDGQKPDLVFQKQNNTFAKRHHLRIWQRPGTFQGREIWVSSATHDTGIEFSQENRTFIHKIDSNIDRERTKVVSDLLFTGLIKGSELVARPAVPRNSKNATGDSLLTDGAMAVLLLD